MQVAQVMQKLRVVALGLACVFAARGAGADVVSDRAAAILIWPDITAVAVAVEGVDGMGAGGAIDFQGIDTLVQISNTSQEPIAAHCFYENANHHCSNTGQVCLFPSDCCDSGGCGQCQAGWIETDFRVRITPRQPLGWRASQGLDRDEVPLTGAPGSTGIGGSSNAGTVVPPVSESIYNGALKCIAINEDGTPTDRNVLEGESTRLVAVGENLAVAKHNAVGLRAIQGAVNDDRELVLGGGGAEYEGCSEMLIVNHFFDGVIDPVIGAQAEELFAAPSGFLGSGTPGEIRTRLTLVPCTQDLLRQIPGSAVVQYLVYNEFEQRFSTSRRVDCKFERLLSSIDTTDPDRSIFSAGVSGTVAGQSRLRAIGSGLVGVATEARFFSDADDGTTGASRIEPGAERSVFGLFDIVGADMADFNIHQQGDRAESDVITLP